MAASTPTFPLNTLQEERAMTFVDDSGGSNGIGIGCVAGSAASISLYNHQQSLLPVGRPVQPNAVSNKSLSTLSTPPDPRLSDDDSSGDGVIQVLPTMLLNCSIADFELEVLLDSAGNKVEPKMHQCVKIRGVEMKRLPLALLRNFCMMNGVVDFPEDATQSSLLVALAAKKMNFNSWVDQENRDLFLDPPMPKAAPLASHSDTPISVEDEIDCDEEKEEEGKDTIKTPSTTLVFSSSDDSDADDEGKDEGGEDAINNLLKAMSTDQLKTVADAGRCKARTKAAANKDAKRLKSEAKKFEKIKARELAKSIELSATAANDILNESQAPQVLAAGAEQAAESKSKGKSNKSKAAVAAKPSQPKGKSNKSKAAVAAKPLQPRKAPTAKKVKEGANKEVNKAPSTTTSKRKTRDGITAPANSNGANESSDDACNHEQFEIGTSFKEEVQPGYPRFKDQVCQGKECGLIIAYDKAAIRKHGKEKCAWATVTAPVYNCICCQSWFICNACWKPAAAEFLKLADESAGGRKSGRKRPALRVHDM
jgi:hypothetical protein